MAPLHPCRGDYDAHAVVRASRKAWRILRRSAHWNGLRKRIASFLEANGSALYVKRDSPVITAELPASVPLQELESLCLDLLSWRTGPYQLGDLFLDTEWRSFKKWERIAPLLPPLQGKRIVDVGCSNGYFLHKLSTLNPSLIIGCDPIERCWLQFALLQGILQTPNVAFLPIGLLDLASFPSFFDLVLCMGVIYHQRDHALATQRIFEATKPGGYAILESLVVNQEPPLTITPPDRYAKMRNAWTIPSSHSLRKLFEGVGFTEVSVHSYGPLTIDEQRSTPFAPYESLSDFLDPNDSTRTVEGHPAPHTALVIGRRP